MAIEKEPSPTQNKPERELGTVVSTFESPTTGKFSFVISDKGLRKGQFVQNDTADGLLFGVVTEITRANRYFEHAEAVAEYERSAPIRQQFPTEDWEYVIAECKALGVFSAERLVRNTFPAAPGSKIYSADEQLLRKFLGFDEKNGLNVGRLQNHNVDVKLPLNELFQKHVAVLAQSGAGKSYLCSVILEELLERKREQGRLAVIVIDVHGEYAGLRKSAYGDRVEVFDGNKIALSLRQVSGQMLASWLPELRSAGLRDLERILDEMKKEMKLEHKAYGLADLLQRIAGSEIKAGTKAPLLSWLSSLRSLRLIGKVSYPPMKAIAQPGKLSVIDLSDIDSQKKKQIIVAYLARKLFVGRKKNKLPPFLLLIEEAHNFAPEKAMKGQAIARSHITTIAREGRKFGASVCLVSQRPVHLSTTVLSQCNTNIILRVTNPYDLKHIGESCEGIDNSMLASITTLRCGEALIIGSALNYPVFVSVRRRRSAHTCKGESLEKLARQFDQAEGKKEEEVEAFL